MGNNSSNWSKGSNYFADIAGDDNEITLDELTTWLMKTFNVNNLNPETWKQILANAATKGIVANDVQFNKNGGMIKFQNGGSAESEQQQIIKQIIEKVKQARAGVAEARQWIASVKEQSRRSPRYKQKYIRLDNKNNGIVQEQLSDEFDKENKLSFIMYDIKDLKHIYKFGYEPLPKVEGRYKWW